MNPTDLLKMPYGRVIVPEADGSFFATIEEFPGCIATGFSAAEALANLESVAESWLEATLEQGQTVPPPTRLPEFWPEWPTPPSAAPQAQQPEQQP